MLSSSFGKNLKITIAGGSHEPEMTVKISGLPQGELIDMNVLQDFMKRRAPGQSKETTSRKETDLVLIKTHEGDIHPDKFETTNKAMTFVIKNENHNSREYNLKLPRPGHADLPAYLKYGDKVNMSGGGPFSGRMTAMLCIVGGIAIQLLEKQGIHIGSQPLSIGQLGKNRPLDMVAPASATLSESMKSEIAYAKDDNNSVGGVVEVFATGVSCGLGGPMQDGLESYLSYIFYGIPGVKGVEFGNGFASASLMGSENNDDFFALTDNGQIITATNNHGGILGGISTGMPIIARLAFKPTPSIGKSQQTINLVTGNPERVKIEGRHDPCIVPRALPVCEAALAIGLLDQMLEKTSNDTPDLSQLRVEIDEIDEKIVALLNRRMEISKAVAEYKIENNLPITNSAREDEILEKVGPNLESIYKEIFKESKEIQKDLFHNKGKGAKDK